MQDYICHPSSISNEWESKWTAGLNIADLFHFSINIKHCLRFWNPSFRTGNVWVLFHGIYMKLRFFHKNQKATYNLTSKLRVFWCIAVTKVFGKISKLYQSLLILNILSEILELSYIYTKQRVNLYIKAPVRAQSRYWEMYDSGLLILIKCSVNKYKHIFVPCPWLAGPKAVRCKYYLCGSWVCKRICCFFSAATQKHFT